MQVEQLRELVLDSLTDSKAMDISVLDVRNRTSITDYFIIASGTSDRHVKATAEAVAFSAKQAGEAPIGQEGVSDGDWALIDLNGIVVHVMRPQVRDFYQLEKLWSVDAGAAAKITPENRK